MLIIEVVFLTVFWTWVVTGFLLLRRTIPHREPITADPRATGLPAETVHFPASDGTPLEGWQIPADPDRPWIIMCHSMRANRQQLLQVAHGLHQARFNVFMFDFRGHGGSAGWSVSWGRNERRDIEGALAWLGQDSSIPPKPYGICGASMGASTSLLVAADDERIGAVVADSAYPRLDESMATYQQYTYPWLPREPFLSFAKFTYLLRFGTRPKNISPRDAARRLSPRPLLLIGGSEDQQTPAKGVRSIHRACGKPKDLWIIKGVGHLQGHDQRPKRYIDRVTKFFEMSLGAGK